MDGVFMFSEEGPVFLAWREPGTGIGNGRFCAFWKKRHRSLWILPLVGQKLALKDANFGTSLMSACIVAAQLVMVPTGPADTVLSVQVSHEPVSPVLANFN
jgi:hypothetical protein